MSGQHEEEPIYMLSEEKIMEVLEAYDLTQSYRSAGLLCGVGPHTVARYVNARAAGLGQTLLSGPARVLVTEPFADKVWEWVDLSRGRIRADVARRKLLAMGYVMKARSAPPAGWLRP